MHEMRSHCDNHNNIQETIQMKRPVLLVETTEEGFVPVTDEVFESTQAADKWATAHKAELVGVKLAIIRVYDTFTFGEEKKVRRASC